MQSIMATYHIDKKGRLSVCLAFFRACPCKQHFKHYEEGLAYLNHLENNRLRYPLLIDEDILNPENKFIVPLDNFKQRELLSGLYTTQDSFVILLDKDSVDKERFHELLKGFIQHGEMSKPDFGRAMETLEGGAGFYMGDQFDARTPYARIAYSRGEDEFNKMYMESALYFYDKLAQSKQENIVDMATAFHYKITDKILEDGTRLRFFTREEPIQYDLEKDFQDFVGKQSGGQTR